MHPARLILLVAMVAMVGSLLLPTATVVAQDPGGQEERAHEMIKNQLDSKKLDMDFDETSLEDVLEYIKQRSGINIVLDPKVADDVAEEPISLTLKNISLGSALRIILDFVEMTYTFRHGVLWITSPEEAWKGRTILHIYDVRDLTMRIKNFPGIRIRLRGDDGGGGGGPVWEDEDEPVEVPTTDDLEEIIPEVCNRESWDNNPEASIMTVMGMLVIRQTPEVHKEIMQLLSQLRANR
ncbi:MAG: hypothetical protein AB7K09_00725 [Planctomycetota bacterium]